MTKRITLHALIDELSNDQLDLALSMLTSINGQISKKSGPQPNQESLELLNDFLADLLSALSSITYDLSKEAEKNQDKILATRYTFTMKKVIESWENYKIKTSKE